VIEAGDHGGAGQHRERADDLERRSSKQVFPPMVCQMISVSETTGALDSMLQEDRRLYEEGRQHGAKPRLAPRGRR
jgi:hypothetical protein